MSDSLNRAAQRGMPVHIETTGYVLRSLTAGDVTPSFIDWLNDKDMMAGLNLPGLNFSEERLKAFITSFDDLHNHFIGIFDRTNGLLIGFYTLDINRTHKVGNITAGIGKREYQGKGVFWATIDALLDHFYIYRDVEKISARILARNHAMLFNFKDNTRFVLEATLKGECLSPDNKRLDILVFSSFKAA